MFGAETRERVRWMRYFLDAKHEDHANAEGRMTEEQKREFMAKFEADLISPAEVATPLPVALNGSYAVGRTRIRIRHRVRIPPRRCRPARARLARRPSG